MFFRLEPIGSRRRPRGGKRYENGMRWSRSPVRGIEPSPGRVSNLNLDQRLRVGSGSRIPAYTSLHMATTEDPRRLDATEEWRRELYDAKPERDALFTTMSGLPIEPLYSPDTVEIDYERDLGYPGVYPFTRGVYPSMYRGRLWTMRQFAGFGTAEETNVRFRYLLEHGQTGLSTAFDMPTLMGYDSDHPKSLGEVGREGVAIDSLEDMEQLFAGIPLDEVSTSMTINAPAAMLLAFYICVGEEQGVARDRLRGTIQTDILKEYIAQKEWIFPPEPSMRLCVDMIEFCAKRGAAVAPGVDLRLPHPGGRLDRRPGARLHPRRRVRLRRGGGGPGPRRRRLRPAALVLLQRAHRLLRGDREVPRRPAHLGARAARAVRREEPALVADALPHADRRRLADRPAARGQHRPHRDRGARRRPRGDAVAAHELVRRGARAPDRARREARPPHPAGDRARDRRRPTRSIRSAARTSSRTSPTASRRRPTTTSGASASSAASWPRSGRTSSSARSPRRPSASRTRSRRGSGSSSA